MSKHPNVFVRFLSRATTHLDGLTEQLSANTVVELGAPAMRKGSLPRPRRGHSATRARMPLIASSSRPENAAP